MWVFAVERDGSASKIIQLAEVQASNRGLSQVCLVYIHGRCLSERLHEPESGRPEILVQADSLSIFFSELESNFERFHRDDGCVGVLRQDGVKVNMSPPLKEDATGGRLMWGFRDDEAIRRCVPTGLRILSVSLFDWDQREFRDAEQERLRCVQQTGHDMMDDRLRCVSPANAIIPRISGGEVRASQVPKDQESRNKRASTVPDRTLGRGRKCFERKSRRIKH